MKLVFTSLTSLAGKQALAVSQSSKPQTVQSHSRRCPQGSSRPSTALKSKGLAEPRVVELPDSAEPTKMVAAVAASRTAAVAPPASRGKANQSVQAAAAVFGLAALSSCTYQVLSSASLPPLAPVLHAVPEVLGIAAATAAAAVVSAKLALGDKFHVELHRGRVYVQAGVPSQGPPINPAACIVTRPTGDVRGNGAYATAAIPAGSHIADYSGQLLDRQGFFSKYPDGVGNFAMAIDQEWVIDAAELVADTSSFHPVHMNHSRVRPNVLRYYNRHAGRVAFFAARDIQPGEELLYNYGRDYWRGREHLELP